MQLLEELRALLVRAQRAENACVQKLNALLASNPTDRVAYQQLTERCLATRQRSVAAYDAWSRAARRFADSASDGTMALPIEDVSNETLPTS